ncbi:MAG: gfo/Idh/MocA family oxidoreductase [Chlamydiae bacterium]|nr:MAG: gfo/Idh/MocA family oxidoreductase [Chlamydiota bacterium]
MKKVRIGVVGLGKIGAEHVQTIKKIKNIRLTAVCDQQKKLADKISDENNLTAFYSTNDLMNSAEVDAVIIATPHYLHTPLAIDALNAGLHVLCEKPVAVHKADAEIMIAAHKKHPKLKFAAMLQLRTSGYWGKIKEIIDSGELGKIYRVNWIVTYWFRTQKYFDDSPWRATWKGEGGGVLLNQAPHQLDLFQWYFGMPVKVRAYCSLGKYHNIEVEDEVTAYCEFKEGFSGVFITSTGEFPGSDRLEIMADRGRLVCENGKIIFDRAESSVNEFSRTTNVAFSVPEIKTIEIKFNEKKGVHQNIFENFADSILNGTELIATGEDGMNSVELANTFLYSSLKNVTVKLPLDSSEYAKLLLNKIRRT